MVNILKDSPDELAQTLFRIGAVKVNFSKPYRLGSGDLSPLYCDARLLLSDVDARSQVCSRILFWINSRYREIDAVVGVASGGIAWAMSLANCKTLPCLYARRDPKDHGLLNQIEGTLPNDGAKVVVIDDVITTGRSTLSVCEALRRGKDGKRAEVLGVFTIFDWDFTVVNQRFDQAKISKTRIVTLDSLVNYGVQNGFLSDEDKRRINIFYQEYCR